MKILAMIDVHKIVGKLHVLRGLSFSLGSGGFVLIRGRSGSGKTTLCRISALLERPSSGSVVFMGEDPFSKHGMWKLRLGCIGYIPQFHELVSSLTIGENIELPLRLLGIPKETRRRVVSEISRRLGIDRILDRFPGEVSGGESQRAAIARALAKEPLLLVADEPFSHLDEYSEELVRELFKEHIESGGAILMTTTELGKSYGEKRSLCIYEGRLKECGGLRPKR
jgi:ABC-type lipoprotein export system ATPase subunit